MSDTNTQMIPFTEEELNAIQLSLVDTMILSRGYNMTSDDHVRIHQLNEINAKISKYRVKDSTAVEA